MKFAICNETFQDWPIEQAFGYARELGYTGIEIAPFTLASDAREITESMRRTVRDAARDAGLEVIGLHWLLAKTTGYYLTSPDVEVRRRTAEYLGVLAQLCRDVGGQILVFGSPLQRNLLPGVSLEQAHSYAAEVIELALPALDKYDIVLALEPLGPQEGDFWRTADETMETVNRFMSRRVRLHLDVKAMSTEAIPIHEVIRKHSDAMIHFHANDANRRGPGMGDVDYIPIFSTLRELRYSGWVSVEVFDYEPGVERLASESLQYMQRCADQLGIAYDR